MVCVCLIEQSSKRVRFVPDTVLIIDTYINLRDSTIIRHSITIQIHLYQCEWLLCMQISLAGLAHLCTHPWAKKKVWLKRLDFYTFSIGINTWLYNSTNLENIFWQPSLYTFTPKYLNVRIESTEQEVNTYPLKIIFFVGSCLRIQIPFIILNRY